MYTSDSLFCKSVLSIPIPTHDPLLHNDLVPEAGCSSCPTTSKLHIKGHHETHHQNSHSHNLEEQSKSPDLWSTSPQMNDPCSISLTKINGKDPPAGKKTATQETNQSSEETANDFLHRIDSSIAKTRDQLEKKVGAAGVSYSYSENDLFSINQPATASVSRSRSARFKSKLPAPLDSASSNGGGEEVPACYIRTADSKVRYSMRRLEQEQDELFQL